MSGGFPLGWDVSNGQSAGVVVTSGNNGHGITSGAANTKGSWTALTSSSPVDCCLLEISVIGETISGGAADTLVIDIGVGPSIPIVIIPNLICAFGNGNGAFFNLLVPCSIPAGSVISARAQSTLGGDETYVAVKMYDGAFTEMEGISGCDAIGFNAASTIGTAVTLGGGAKGAWSTITSSTTHDYVGFAIGIDTQNNIGGLYGSASIDVGVGPSTPHIIIPDWGAVGDQRRFPLFQIFIL